ncbi:PP2C family protein-serine/threonine phosphatase [Streptomyces sp. NBC_01190]|uniref:PP2C family protein-serine/threonine phosphatase n=1 Tax=Streptomyces sp. NBC_01190 TaxID=2903767 RepID=UPI00386C278D|nr:serine/threonine-protein phosphatase [Streptomyces sp. NBC_01190]
MKKAWSKVSTLLERAESDYPSRVGVVLPLIAIALVVAADLLAGRDHYLTPGIVVAPALASLTLRWRGTLFIALLGAAVQGALAPYDGATDIPSHDVLFGQVFAYAAVSVFSVYISWRREAGARAYTAITTVAEAAQHALMRPPPARVGGVRLAVRYVSAATDAQIGGDLYAVLDTPYGVRAMVGDVRGKGLQAVQAASVVLGSFREAAYDEGGLGTAAARVDVSVRRNVTTGEFITALFAQFDRPDSVQLLHYGHVAPLRVSRDGSVETLNPADPWVPLGLADMVEGEPVPWRVPMRPGDVLVLCTDGVIEARSPRDNTFYPLTERVGPLIAGCGTDLDAAVQQVYADLLRHAGGSLSDDVVLLLLTPLPYPLPAEPTGPREDVL